MLLCTERQGQRVLALAYTRIGAMVSTSLGALGCGGTEKAPSGFLYLFGTPGGT